MKPTSPHEEGDKVKMVENQAIKVKEISESCQNLHELAANISKIQIPKITHVKSLRLFETFDRLKALGRMEDKGGFQENKEWKNCW